MGALLLEGYMENSQPGKIPIHINNFMMNITSSTSHNKTQSDHTSIHPYIHMGFLLDTLSNTFIFESINNMKTQLF